MGEKQVSLSAAGEGIDEALLRTETCRKKARVTESDVALGSEAHPSQAVSETSHCSASFL